MIQIYTGNGKGKTTAALGLALRAVGHGKNVIIIQFMKGKINYGELKAAKYLKNLKIEQYGRPDFVDRNNPAKIDIELARKGFKKAKAIIKSKKYDIVILDELNVAIDYGLVQLNEIVELLKTIPIKIELVITGRYMPQELLEYADLVSEICEIKHYFQKGIKARKGIEY
ncbi:MAG: cob(I)yrinic acid a,c-diamide adenosyltransferase [bacterium (Candidatus Stahlbacteria) CG23_combo_of_CG06-09_8_20_14_all_34_7]|nr:MAG: cob(I)yrinic acid a,c-diamide adenosyltransferase [bacterium (Candidatus Stahlbacteria) CG23_combo_of_CG06-09_8_20_14_all_34_7]